MALNILDLIQYPEKLADRHVLHELSEMLEEYPYYQTARLLYLKGLYLLHDAAFGEELQRTALYISNRKMLFYLIEGSHYTLQPKEHKVRKEDTSNSADRTLSLIDTFLQGLPVEEEEETIPIVDDGGLSADYTSYVLREENLSTQERETNSVPRMRGQELIDNFIKNADGHLSSSLSDEQPEGPVLLPYEEDDDSCFTETLAKIYIKQHRYAKALEIIRRLSLKYPKKNAYFADQIRLLEKLVINSTDK